MVKYTEEQLLAVRETAHVSNPEILEAFNQMVDQVKEHAALEAEKHKVKWNNGDTYIDENGNERPYHHLNRRRGSRTGTKPNLRKKSVDVVQEEDGWATLKSKKSFGNEEGEEERSKFRESIRETVKAKPNNKNLGSSKAVDPRDAIADKQTKAFNAFAALGDEDEDDEDDDDEATA